MSQYAASNPYFTAPGTSQSAGAAAASTSHYGAAADHATHGAGPYYPDDYEYSNPAQFDDYQAQASVYDPVVQAKLAAKPTKLARGQKQETVLRSANGRKWEDRTLIDWDESWFTLLVRNLSNDVTDLKLEEAFRNFPTFQKARVVKERITFKTKYGFVAFSDPEEGLKAWKQMKNAYVGNRPIELLRATGQSQRAEISATRQRKILEGLDGGQGGSARAKAGGKTGKGRLTGVARPTPY